MVEVYRNKGLRILLMTNALVLVSSAMLNPIYAFFIGEVGGDLLDASFAGTIYAFTAALVSYLTGKFSDKLKEKEYIVIAGYLIIAISYFLLCFVDNMIFLFAVQMMIGLGEAIYSPSFDALYSKHLDVKKAGVQWGAWESMNYGTIGLGALIGGFLANAFGFDFLFIVMGTVSLFSAIYIFLLPRKDL